MLLAITNDLFYLRMYSLLGQWPNSSMFQIIVNRKMVVELVLISRIFEYGCIESNNMCLATRSTLRYWSMLRMLFRSTLEMNSGVVIIMESILVHQG